AVPAGAGAGLVADLVEDEHAEPGAEQLADLADRFAQDRGRFGVGHAGVVFLVFAEAAPVVGGQAPLGDVDRDRAGGAVFGGLGEEVFEAPAPAVVGVDHPAADVVAEVRDRRVHA